MDDHSDKSIAGGVSLMVSIFINKTNIKVSCVFKIRVSSINSVCRNLIYGCDGVGLQTHPQFNQQQTKKDHRINENI